METVKLIVYGTLMTGECNHFYCGNALSVQPCTIQGTLFDTRYGYPAFVPEGSTPVKAEFIEIPLADWSDIDALEEYPEVYDRQILQAVLADGTVVSGWIYIMNELPVGAKLIPGGDWKEFHHNR